MGSELQPTHLDKIYWPKAGYTKGDLIDYSERMASTMLPYLTERPMVMKRFPDGIEGESFFHKDLLDEHRPSFVRTAMIPAKTVEKNVHYIVCDNKETLAYMANLGAIELHPWSSRLKHLEKPDWMIFDLDPGERATLSMVIDVACAVKAALDEHGMTSYVKTSGKRGLHVYVPVGATYPYEQVRAFAHRLGEHIVERHPTLASLATHPAERTDKVFIDYLRNAFGQTAIAPYGLRATPTATVSTPLEWSEVTQKLDPAHFTIKTIFKRLEEKGDLWKTLLTGHVRLPRL